ncbi:unnamed protein product [Ambrosiozyma monospora]|uniref:Unnamed protein product n=1 Tax=Ambrosiozyma monospora TaxID=43982 RepID=A0ACB5TBS4_AMBMO|nr:unnamed protein product [Ambrosiozyma monospora]
MRRLLIESYLDGISELIDNLKRVHDGQLGNLIKSEYGLLIVDLLNLLTTLILKSEKGFSKKSVTTWFKLMAKTGYLSEITPLIVSVNSQEGLTIESLASVVSLLFLDLDFNFGALDDESSFMNDPEDLFTIDECISESSANPIILYAWSIILHRKYIMISQDPENNKAVTIVSKLDGLKSIEGRFLKYAEEAAMFDVFGALNSCHKLLQYDEVYSSILGSFIVAIVPYIKLTDEVVTTIRDILDSCPDQLIVRFFSDEAAEDLLALARAKMPISLKAFISLVSINANLAVEELTNLKSYMEIFKEDDFYYKYRIDDQNPDLVKLTQDIDILPPFEANGELSLLLKEGTSAQIFPSGSANSNQLIVAFLYEKSGIINRNLQIVGQGVYRC